MPISRDQVQNLRRSFTGDKAYETFEVEVQGQYFTCFVLPPTLCPELPNFAMQFVADDRIDPDQDAIFGVSGAIRDSWRQFVVTHEIQEYWLGMTCAEAMRRETSAVMNSDLPEDEQEEYLRMRREFFAALVPYATAQGYPADKLEQFEGTRAFLFTLENLS